jgi:protein involved in polysaccharide export with SLBB domain
VQVLRGDKTITTISLYDFLINGTMPLIQLQDGDRVLVAPLGKQVSIGGNVANPYLFEIKDGQTLKELLAYAQPGPNVTHVRIDSRNNGQGSSVVYPLADVVDQALHAGDDITVVSDIKPTTIAVSIAGEFSGSQELILPWGANLQDALDKIQYTDLSNKQAINLYRKSVQQRQKAMLDASLNSLEQSVLNARSATNETANLRKTEAEVVLQWVAKAKEVMPRGQVIITNKKEMQKLILEHGDTIVIPRKNTLVLVHGDVMFPNAVTYEKGYEVQDYIASAGGFSQDPDNAVVVLLKPDGKYDRLASGDLDEEKAEPGDEIFVLPQVDMKSLQVTKDITQILYQIAVSAGVVLAL